MSGYTPPKKLSHRHYMVALMAAQGVPLDEIAKQSGYGYTRVRGLLKSELVGGLVERYRTDLLQKAAHDLQDRIMADAPNTLQRLQDIRDNKNDTIAIKACNTLADRQFPRKTLHEEDRTLRLILSHEEQTLMKRLMVEDEAPCLDITPTVD